MLKHILLFFVIISFPISAQAGSAWFTSLKINNLIATGSDNASGLILVTDQVVAVPGTTTCSTNYFYLNASTEKGKAMLAMALTAKSQNLFIQLSFTDIGCTSSVGRGTIYGLRF